ncbi:MAG: hypothetical protein ABEI53_02435, partial [Candidatus Magasanikbacteria bacterium]
KYLPGQMEISALIAFESDWSLVLVTFFWVELVVARLARTSGSSVNRSSSYLVFKLGNSFVFCEGNHLTWSTC